MSVVGVMVLGVGYCPRVLSLFHCHGWHYDSTLPSSGDGEN